MGNWKIIMNSFLDGVWGPEESIPLPVGPGRYAVTILVTDEGYEVYEHGQLRYLYRHRAPYSLVTSVEPEFKYVWDVVGSW